MQSKTTLRRIAGFFQKGLMILGLFCFFTGKINAQIYVNGNLSTGPTASTGAPAPAGSNWSEVQVGNANAGFAANIANGFAVADDFTIGAGTWGVTKFTCYSYSTGATGATSPFNDMRVQIFNTDPSVGTPVPIFGDLTTNRLTSSTQAGLYRIFNGAPGNTRNVWKNEANISISLPAGTYWVEWQMGTALASNFSPASTVVGTTTQPGNNAKQHTIAGNVWAGILDGPTATDPQDMPFQIDYTTTICSGTPTPGATLSTATTVCPTIPFTLTVQNATAGSGLTYQWQSSATGGAGSFTDITGATNSSLSTTLTAATYYQLVVVCSGGTPGVSTPIQVALTPSNGCYCIPATTDCTDGDIINNVTLATLNNPSGCGTNGYTNYTIDPTITIPDVYQGIGNPISVDAGGGLYDETVGVWIDFDRSGSFDASEFTFVGATTGGVVTSNINVPANAPLGNTRMRVRVRFNTPLAGGMACVPYAFGETEDYTVNIVPCVQGVFNSQPANASVACGGNASFSISATGTLLSYQWQEKIGTGPWTTVVNGGAYAGATSATLTISSVTANWDGNQYRVLIGGGCTAIDFSDIATLTITPLVIEVSPASYSTCTPIPAGAPVQLSITTQSGSSSTTTTSYASGAINLAIPDLDDEVGITSVINVPALPAGAVITGASVTLNAAHTWAGDMIFALKAPNGKYFSLNYAMHQTGGPGATVQGLVNTVISSTGTTTLDLGTEPWTGVFAPDAYTTVPAGFPALCPTALNPAGTCDAANFAALYSIPNGDWTLGVYDYASPDAGTLNDWTLTLTYTVTSSAPFTGVWTPATGLFLDAAGTIPYAGTSENTVYAAPASNTIYTVTVTNPICPPTPTEVPVLVLTADPTVTISATPGTSIYPGIGSLLTANVSPALSAAGSYQWFYEGTAIQGATSSTYLADFTNGIGDYSVDAIDPNICSGRVNASITITDSVSNILFLWPNPSTGQFQVRYNDGTNDLLTKPPFLQVYDSKGSKLSLQSYKLTTNYGRMDVDLSSQPRGTYFVALYNSSGLLLKSGRVIIR